MKTSYGVGANIWRFQGFYSAFWLILLFYLSSKFDSNFNESVMPFIIFTFFVILWGWINLWLQPIVQIEEDGILVKRLGIAARRKVNWNNFKLYKKVRTITRYCLIGTDPRYSIIEIKDGTIFDKRVAILSFFKDYDEFVAQIEKHLDSSDIVTDKNYS